MRVILIHKARLIDFPPVINDILLLSNLGHDVILVTEEVNNDWKNRLYGMGVKYYEIPLLTTRFKSVGKTFSYVNFKKKAFSIIEKEYEDNSILWIEGAATIFALGVTIKRFRYILQISELHENTSYHLKAIRKVINDAACVFMPEYNRGAIYRVWFKLTKSPIVLPNKPYFVPSFEEIEQLKKKYNSEVSRLEGKKVILYQGLLLPERDLCGFVKAIREIGDDFCLVLLGRDFGMVDKYRVLDENLIHIESLPAPDYLAITSIAYIGIVTYSPWGLNTTFCAPNKIYEYGYFGLPMIGNHIPGLKYTVEEGKAGILVDEYDIEGIKKAIIQIDKNYESYSANAHKLYDALDCREIIKNALNSIGNY